MVGKNLGLESIVQSFGRNVDSLVIARAFEEFILPPFGGKIFKTQRGTIKSMELYSVKKSSELLGKGKGYIQFLINNGQVDYVKFNGQKLVPGGEVRRLIDRPDNCKSYSADEINKKYGLSSAVINQLIEAKILTLKQGKIRGDKLLRLYKELYESKYGVPGEISGNEWFKYRLNGKPFSHKKGLDENLGNQQDISSKLYDYFKALPIKNYCTIVFFSPTGAAIFYVPLSSATSATIQEKFRLLFRYFKDNSDESAKYLHYKDKAENYIAGGLFTRRQKLLEKFVQELNVYIHMSNRYYGLERLELNKSGLDIVGNAVSFLAKIENPSDKVEALPKKHPFRTLVTAVYRTAG